MTELLFSPAPAPILPITGSQQHFPVGRIFCVGRNYVAHAAEMGGSVARDAPWFFTKSQTAVALGPDVPFPPGTENYHHEVEMVVALDQGGSDLSPDETAALIFGYGVGLDMTRRDLQAVSKEKRRPWDTSKDVENSAILGALTAKDAVALGEAAITLKVNGETRQDAPLTDMVWSVGEILSHLSRLYTLRPGDIVLTGTPAGVAAVSRGDHLSARVTGLAPLDVTLR